MIQPSPPPLADRELVFERVMDATADQLAELAASL